MITVSRIIISNINSTKHYKNQEQFKVILVNYNKDIINK